MDGIAIFKYFPDPLERNSAIVRITSFSDVKIGFHPLFDENSKPFSLTEALPSKAGRFSHQNGFQCSS